MEEAEREKSKKRNLQRSWSRRKRRSPLLVLEDWGFLCYWLWEEEGVHCEKEPIRDEIR